MKHVYFVRHGESVTNATKVHLGPDVKLTESGERQAERIAKRLAKYPIERVIASPYERAAKTAHHIAHALMHDVEYSPLFVERRGPSEMRNRRGGDPLVQHIWRTISKHSHIPGWRYSDEEHFGELHGRASEALAYLETIPEHHVAVVTHGMFMKMIFAHVLLGEKLDGRIFWDHFIEHKNIENTGIMHLEFTENYNRSKLFWKLISWNDHAHLEGALV